MEDFFAIGKFPHLRKELGVESSSFGGSAAFCSRLGCKRRHSKRVRVKSAVWSCSSGDRGAVIKKTDLIPNEGAQGPYSLFTARGLATHTLIHTYMVPYTRKHTITYTLMQLNKPNKDC